MSVQEYLEKHRLSMRIEDAVNAAVRAKSTDPVIFIVHALFSPSFCFVSRGFSLPFSRSVLYVTNRKQACFVQFRKGFSGSSWHPVVRFDASLVFITFALASICDLLSLFNSFF